MLAMTNGDSASAMRWDREMKVGNYDVAAAMLLSVAILLGTLVGFAGVAWLLDSRPLPRKEVPGEITCLFPGGKPFDGEIEFDEPTAAEATPLRPTSLDGALQAVSNAIDATNPESLASGHGVSPGSGGKNGIDGRIAGPITGDSGAIPRYERWKLKFSASSMRTYAQQLDFFSIELGAIGGGTQGVDYASQLSGSLIARRGNSAAEHRLYFMWTQENPLQNFDRVLLNQAGISTRGRTLIKFIPQSLEDELAELELAYAKSKGRSKIEEIARTDFECQSSGEGYKFVVLSQAYRSLASTSQSP